MRPGDAEPDHVLLRDEEVGGAGQQSRGDGCSRNAHESGAEEEGTRGQRAADENDGRREADPLVPKVLALEYGTRQVLEAPEEEVHHEQGGGQADDPLVRPWHVKP